VSDSGGHAMPRQTASNRCRRKVTSWIRGGEPDRDVVVSGRTRQSGLDFFSSGSKTVNVASRTECSRSGTYVAASGIAEGVAGKGLAVEAQAPVVEASSTAKKTRILVISLSNDAG